MQLHDPLNDRQTQPRTLDIIRIDISSVKNVIDAFWGDA